MIPILEVGRIDSGPFRQRLAVRPPGDRELHQGPDGTRRDGELTHGSGPFGTCGHEFGARSHSGPVWLPSSLGWSRKPPEDTFMRAIFAALLLSLAAPAAAEQGVSRGIQWFQSRDWAKAKAEFMSAVRGNDLDARAHFYLGRLALIDNDPDAAAEQLRRAGGLADTVSDYHLWYGKAMTQQAMSTQNPMLAMGVKGQLERAAALDGRSLDARDALVDYYSMAPALMGGGADKAREQAGAISRLDAMRGHFALGRIAVRSKDTTAVEREMNAAIPPPPGPPPPPPPPPPLCTHPERKAE